MNESVLIIGAGASGCAAASKLIDNRFSNVKILEAEHRIGGRIDTRRFAANVIDVGAQRFVKWNSRTMTSSWIHIDFFHSLFCTRRCRGELKNAVFSLGRKHDAFASNSTRNDRILLVKSNGRCVDQSDSDNLMNLMSSLLDAHELRGNTIPLGQFITQK